MHRFQPALLGGLFIGVLSSLPLVGSANLCCCLWVVIGGVLTVYLQRQGGSTLDAGEAVLGGLLAGALGALLYVAASALLFSLSSEVIEAQFRAALDEPRIPPEVRDRLSGLMVGRSLILIMGAITLPVYAVFSMLGALLGFAWFRKKTPPAVQA